MAVFNSVLVSFLKIAFYIIVGYVVRKRGLLSKEVRKGITDLIMAVIIPCSIITSFAGSVDTDTLKSCIAVFVLSFALSFAGMIVGAIFYRKNPRSDSVIRYGLACPNVSFLGSPIVNALYGAPGMIYWSVFMVPYRLIMYTYGVACYTRPSGRDVVKKFFLNPCVICTIIGLIIMLAKIQVPAGIISTLNYGGNCLTGLSMLVIGGIVADADKRDLFNKNTISFSVLRLIVFPAATILVCWLFKVDAVVAGVCVVLAGTPTSTMNTLFAEKYDGDSELSAKLTVITTIASLLTIPLIAALLGAILGT